MRIDDKFFWFKRNRIAIPGVQGEHLLMHITDTHIDAVDELSTDEEREKVRQQTELWNKFRGKFAAANGEPCGPEQDVPTLEAFEKQMMDLSVNIPLEEALDLGWKILADCFEPSETGIKTELVKQFWPSAK